jgi:hypothetical protein
MILAKGMKPFISFDRSIARSTAEWCRNDFCLRRLGSIYISVLTQGAVATAYALWCSVIVVSICRFVHGRVALAAFGRRPSTNHSNLQGTRSCCQALVAVLWSVCVNWSRKNAQQSPIALAAADAVSPFPPHPSTQTHGNVCSPLNRLAVSSRLLPRT